MFKGHVDSAPSEACCRCLSKSYLIASIERCIDAVENLHPQNAPRGENEPRATKKIKYHAQYNEGNSSTLRFLFIDEP